MKLVKALNNNVALVLNDNRREEIVMGSGIAYNMRPGDRIRDSLIEKRFVLDMEHGRKDFDNLLKRISVSDIELASTIIKRGEKVLGYQCSDTILLTLSDHLGMMLDRAKKGIYFATALEWDIKLIYPKEYRYAKTVVAALKKKTRYDIPEQEAAFIALHFINANQDMEGMHQTIETTKIIQNILNITKLYYGRELNVEDFDVGRFIVHVRYFVQRQIKGSGLDMDLSIAEAIAKSCPNDYKCAVKIADFLKKKYDWDVNDAELLYLTLHLNRISKG